jgi:amidohydrolase
MDITALAKEFTPELIRLRRDFHMHPELGTEEIRTVGVVETVLHSLGIETKRVADTGLVGMLHGRGPGKTIALRADMDALPLPDKKTVEYASKIPNKMHACGHDVHTASLLGGAMILSRMKQHFAGTVKFFFQPAEETVGGADRMIKAGVLENPAVDAVFGLHTAMDIEVGKIGVPYGKTCAACDQIDIIVHGRSSHGAAPHRGVDAIIVMAQIITALQTIVSRTVDPVDSAVITIGTVNGGYQRNIIADEVTLTGTLRTLEANTRVAVKERIQKVAEGVAASLGANAQVIFTPHCPSVINHDSMAELVKQSASGLLGQDKVVVLTKPGMGFEDFAYFLEAVPGAFYRLGIRNDAKGINQPGHSSLYDVDEACLPIGAAMHAKIVLDFLGSKD